MKRLAGSQGEGSSGGEAKAKRARTRKDVESVGRYDHYRKGSIVRVTLHNFMSYTDAHFEPGPLLNVILGPNGTGACPRAVIRMEQWRRRRRRRERERERERERASVEQNRT